jgi:hypothetical protein
MSSSLEVEFLSQFATKKGWLQKSGGSVKSWKRRFVTLLGPFLYYFESAEVNGGSYMKKVVSLVVSVI